MSAWYNEIDPFKAEVLRQAIKAGAIAPGMVDERSIKDIEPDELVRYTQCHFFAGGGFWSVALRQAGWPDDRPVWTGSCPCPSFSAAGKGEGFDDPRHLWPDWDKLVDKCRPPVIFGEQVAAAIGHGWLDLVQTDMEAKAYAIGSAVLGACSVGGSDIRQRLYFVAYASSARAGRYAGDVLSATAESGSEGNTDRENIAGTSLTCGTTGIVAYAESSGSGTGLCSEGSARERRVVAAAVCSDVRLGVSEDAGLQERVMHFGSVCQADGTPQGQRLERRSNPGIMGDTNLSSATRLGRDGRASTATRRLRTGSCDSGESSGLADADGRNSSAEGLQRSGQHRLVAENSRVSDGRRASPLNGPWRDADWLLCRDGKWRPVAPGTFPLVNGYPGRVGALRLYGDAINCEVAKTWIEVAMECL